MNNDDIEALYLESLEADDAAWEQAFHALAQESTTALAPAAEPRSRAG